VQCDDDDDEDEKVDDNDDDDGDYDGNVMRCDVLPCMKIIKTRRYGKERKEAQY